MTEENQERVKKEKKTIRKRLIIDPRVRTHTHVYIMIVKH